LLLDFSLNRDTSPYNMQRLVRKVGPFKILNISQTQKLQKCYFVSELVCSLLQSLLLTVLSLFH